MRINLAEHTDLVRGTVEVEETSEGVRCSRFTGQARKLFPGETDSVNTTAGVRVSLATDTNELTMRLQRVDNADGSAQPYQVDVLVDRADCHTFESDGDVDDFFFNIELEPRDGDDAEDDHLVEIFLPPSANVLIREFEISDGALFRPLYPGDERILFIGDAFMLGEGASSPLRGYANLLATEMSCDFLNWSVSGLPLTGGLGEAALEIEWQSAVVTGGSSDYLLGRSAADAAVDLNVMLNALSSRSGARINLITPLLLPELENVPNLAGSTLGDFREAFSRVAAGVPGCRLIDGSSLLSNRKRLYSGDRMSLSDAGMEAVAEKLQREIIGAYRF
ncbi:MAG: SGNH/GDSL hydrolase family protein [Lentisphaeria bacterium]|nr:SGNH/GDSL hydrolase family protein [Lentisphaeria bacterium]